MSWKMDRDLTPQQRETVKRAKSAVQSKNYDYAITLYQAILKEEPLYEGRRILRAVEIQKVKAMGSFTRQMANMRVSGAAMKAFSGKKTPQEQLAAAEEILALDPYNQKANQTIGEAGDALGCPELKCFAYETLAESKADAKPGDKTVPPLLTSLAKAYEEAKDYGKAISTYERILELDPRNGEALSGLKAMEAARASKTGGWEEAKDYRDVLKDKAMSEQLEQQSKIVKSSDAIEDQIKVNFEKHQAEPSNPNYPKAIAALFVSQNNYASAAQWYQYAYDLGEQQDSSLEKTIGDLTLKAKEQEVSLVHAELVQLNEQLAAADEEARPQLEADIAAKTQEAATKEQELDQVRLNLAETRVRAQPNEGEFRYDLGEALFRVGQYKRATEELQQSLKQPSVRYPALNLMGQAFMKRNMMDFAIKQLSLAEGELLGMDEMKKQIVYNLGLAYEATKQPDKALDQWKKIYEYDMSYRDVAARVEASYGGSQDGTNGA
jgi:tetratricopeptide (TPR) repeat protein